MLFLSEYLSASEIMLDLANFTKEKNYDRRKIR